MSFGDSAWPAAIIHVDGDAFFASCEQAVHPEYRGKPVVTGKERGIVAAASYEAKAKGVSRGVPLWDVKKLCPDAIIVPSDYETYSIFSKRMFAIMRRFTPIVEEYSIDEGFADITGLRGPMHASYETIARTMQETIIRELGVSVSMGLSLSKVLAKVGSKHKKPHGFVAILSSAIDTYLQQTPLEKIWGIGPNTSPYATKIGITTALDFTQRSEAFITTHFAKPYQEIWRELRGESVYPIATEEKNRYLSISKTKTFTPLEVRPAAGTAAAARGDLPLTGFTPPSTVRAFVFAQLAKNLENACIKARRHNLVARRIVVFLKTQEFRHAAAEGVLSRPSAYPHDMIPIVRTLFDACFRGHAEYRATGIVLCDLIPDDTIQQSLFDAPLQLKKLQRVYAAIDTLSAHYGKHAVTLGASLPAHTMSLHTTSRGDIPIRKRERLKGETKRLHLSLPIIL
ncbi:DNA polymerase IV [Candidatus Uhrbacteria bacterium]|nr:DNA polymerase IV [Candidatus Uhrbacteria bacterium]